VAVITHTDGKTTEVKPNDKSGFSLEELQGYVGGLIQVVPYSATETDISYINEEGLLLGLPYNYVASSTFGVDLVGDVITVPFTEERGDA